MQGPQLLQQEFRRVDVRFDRSDRALGNQLHSHRRREMKNLVGLGRQFPDQRPVGDAAFDVAESRMVDHGGQIGDRAGRFVVHDRHAVAAGQEGLGQVAADKACPAGDENVSHEPFLPQPLTKTCFTSRFSHNR